LIGGEQNTIRCLPKIYLTKLDAVLSAGISINMYMFHGGTTRGFMNGANYNDKDPYEPQISSYDYDAPLNEAGNATDKFMKFRSVIAKHLLAGQTLPEVPAAKPSIAIPAIKFTRAVSLFNTLPAAKLSEKPLTFEDLNQAYGFVLYRTTLNGSKSGMLKINGLRDYGLVYINGKRVAILDRRLKQDSVNIDLPKGKVVLDVLVENLGRINFGPNLLKNKKGITGSVLLAGKELKNWKVYGMPFNDITKISLKAGVHNAGQPVVKSGSFKLSQVADTYLDMSKWGKGIVWINGHNLGRYWYIGPQQTLYVPAEWLKKGGNDVTVLELIKPEQNELKAIDHAILDKLAN
jgi:beta-galactosidase